MLNHNDSEIAAKLQELLDVQDKELNIISGYSQRETKLKASALVKMLALGWLEKPSGSLSDVVASGRQMGIGVSEQGLQGRLDKRAVLLMAGVFQASVKNLQRRQKLASSWLEKFSAVQILDSTQVRVPAWFGGEFYDPRRRYAGMKLHLVFDYLHGQLEALDMTSAHEPDQAYMMQPHMVRGNSLWLFDLGYFSQDTLQTLSLL